MSPSTPMNHGVFNYLNDTPLLFCRFIINHFIALRKGDSFKQSQFDKLQYKIQPLITKRSISRAKNR